MFLFFPEMPIIYRSEVDEGGDCTFAGQIDGRVPKQSDSTDDERDDHRPSAADFFHPPPGQKDSYKKIKC